MLAPAYDGRVTMQISCAMPSHQCIFAICHCALFLTALHGFSVTTTDDGGSTTGLRAGAGRAILREQDFADSQLYEVADTISAARMLMLHRVDAWYGPVLQFRSWRHAGHHL